MPNRASKNSWFPAIAGFIAAILTVRWLNPYPPRVSGVLGVLVIYFSALKYILIVVAVSAFVVWLTSLGKRQQARLTWRIAARTAWFVPLSLFMAARSGWAVVAMALLTLGIIYIIRNLQAPVKQKPALSSDARMQACVMAGAAIELGLVAAGTYHPIQAVFLIGLAAAIVGWNATKPGEYGHPARGLIILSIAFVFTSGALVRGSRVQGGDSYLGPIGDPAVVASLHALQSTFGEGSIMPDMPDIPKSGDRKKVEVEGLSHRGIFLWPEEKKEVTLVPPLPNLSRNPFGKDNKTPLSIPFYGVYWFFRYPYRQPPPESLIAHGSPALKKFLSNDRSPLWEEAHQDLKTEFDVGCCGAIEIDVTNAEKHAELFEMELVLVSHTKTGKTEQPLGKMHLVTRPQALAIPETLSFKIPSPSKVRRFDEFVIKMHMVAPLSLDAAQVAIERFRLVPKGRR